MTIRHYKMTIYMTSKNKTKKKRKEKVSTKTLN